MDRDYRTSRCPSKDHKWKSKQKKINNRTLQNKNVWITKREFTTYHTYLLISSRATT